MIDGIEAAVPGFRASLRCVFTREHAVFTFEDGRTRSGSEIDWSRPTTGRVRVTKDLKSLARHCGRPLCRCLIVDDTAETYRLNPSNALPVPMYEGKEVDHALECLRDFLLHKMPTNGARACMQSLPRCLPPSP